jgi:hypothetical protein
MKLTLALAALAAGTLPLAGCGDDGRMAGDDPLRDTQEARRDDSGYPSTMTTTSGTLGNPPLSDPTPTGTGSTNPDGTTTPDDDGIPPPSSPGAPPPTLPPN